MKFIFWLLLQIIIPCRIYYLCWPKRRGQRPWRNRRPASNTCWWRPGAGRHLRPIRSWSWAKTTTRKWFLKKAGNSNSKICFSINLKCQYFTDHGERVRRVSGSFLVRAVVPPQHETDGQSEISAKNVNEHRRSDIRNLNRINKLNENNWPIKSNFNEWTW